MDYYELFQISSKYFVKVCQYLESDESTLSQFSLQDTDKYIYNSVHAHVHCTFDYDQDGT